MAGVQLNTPLATPISPAQKAECRSFLDKNNISSFNDMTLEHAAELAKSLGLNPQYWQQKLEKLDPVLDKTKLENMFNNLKETCEVADQRGSCEAICDS